MPKLKFSDIIISTLLMALASIIVYILLSLIVNLRSINKEYATALFIYGMLTFLYISIVGILIGSILNLKRGKLILIIILSFISISILLWEFVLIGEKKMKQQQNSELQEDIEK